MIISCSLPSRSLMSLLNILHCSVPQVLSSPTGSRSRPSASATSTGISFRENPCEPARWSGMSGRIAELAPNTVSLGHVSCGCCLSIYVVSLWCICSLNQATSLWMARLNNKDMTGSRCSFVSYVCVWFHDSPLVCSITGGTTMPTVVRS